MDFATASAVISFAAAAGSTAMFIHTSRYTTRVLKETLADRRADSSLTFLLLDKLRRFNRHDERVTELLEANNLYLDRARAAERDLRAVENALDQHKLAKPDVSIGDNVAAIAEELVERREEIELLEQELAATKAALKNEEEQADKWSKAYHALKVEVPDEASAA